MKTLKVEAVYPMGHETFDDVAVDIPRFIEQVYNERRLHSSLGYLVPQPSRIKTVAKGSNQSPDRVRR